MDQAGTHTLINQSVEAYLHLCTACLALQSDYADTEYIPDTEQMPCGYLEAIVSFDMTDAQGNEFTETVASEIFDAMDTGCSYLSSYKLLVCE